MSEEKKLARQEILQLLSTGKITAEEAAQLLSGGPAAEVSPPSQPPPASEREELKAVPETADNGQPPRWFHVRVSDLHTGKNKVTVNIPLRLMEFGFNIGRRFAPELAEMNIQDLKAAMVTEKGMLVDVLDEEDGEHVQIYVD